jgi:hypothetical protein
LPHRRTPQGWRKQKARFSQTQFYDRKKRETIALEHIPPHRRTVKTRGSLKRKLYIEHRPPAFPGDVLHTIRGEGLYDMGIIIRFREAFFNP